MSLNRPIAAPLGRHTLLSPAQWAAAYAIAVALIPPCYAYAADGLGSVFGYLAADAFIYLSIAANSQFGFYTFDGTQPTNGFHPLWQVLLQAAFEMLGLASAKAQQISFSFWCSVAMVSIAAVLTTQAILRWTGSLAAAMLTFPGLFGIAMLVIGWPLGTPWSYMNGMESPASLLFLGLALLYLSRSDDVSPVRAATLNHRQLLVLSLLSTGIVFSRLDDIFLPAVIVAWILLQRETPITRRLEAAVWFGVPLGLAIVAYLAVNYTVVGHAMPISSAAKFDFRTPLLNIGFLGSSLHALVPDFLYDPFSANPGDVDIDMVNWRNAQMFLPVIAARVLLGRMHWLDLGKSRTFLTFMRLMLIYVIVKGAYNFLFVPLLHQGHWYYALSITIINVAGAVVLIQHWRQWSVGRPTMRRLLIPVAAVAAALSIALFIHDRQTQAIANDYVAFFERGPAIAERLTETMSDPRIVEVDDGIVNFALGLPTMSGFLFAIDPDAYAAHQAGDFLTAASRRGYQLIGSLYYLRSVTADDLSPETIPDTLRERVFNATKWDLDKFDFELAYWDKPTGAVFIRFTPKP